MINVNVTLMAGCSDRDVNEIDTASNSTVDAASDVEKMTDSEKTVALFQHVLQVKPATVNAKAPTLDEVRSIVQSQFKAAEDLWQALAPKKVISRYQSSK